MTLRKSLALTLALMLGFMPAAAQVNPGTSPLSIAKGGTGGGTASAARSNLGLAWPNNTTTFLRGDGTYQIVNPAAGGTGLDNSAAATNDVPVWNGSGFIHTALLTLINTVCGLTPGTCTALFGHIEPEWFGDGVPCSASSSLGIQLAYNYLGAHGGGKVQLANCSYAVSGVAGITMNLNAVSIEGQGGSFSASTRIVWTPGLAGCAINATAGASILSNIALRHLTIATNDTTTYKQALCISDGSTIVVDDVFIRGFTGGVTGTITGAVASPSNEIRLTVAGASTNWNDGYAVAVSGVGGTVEANFGWPIVVSGANTIDLKGSKFFNAYTSGGTITASSTGVRLFGRELYAFNNVLVSADLPMRISPNPNVAGGAESLDESNFHNMTLAQAIGTNCILMFDPGTEITSDTWDGVQSWGGGKSGVCWRDNITAGISEQVRFDNVRQEQQTVTGGYLFDIEPHNTLYSLYIANPLISSTNGIFLRNIGNWQLDAAHWLNGSGVCLDIDATVQNTQINGSFWLAGASTANLVGQTNVLTSGVHPAGGCLPWFAVYHN